MGKGKGTNTQGRGRDDHDGMDGGSGSPPDTQPCRRLAHLSPAASGEPRPFAYVPHEPQRGWLQPLTRVSSQAANPYRADAGAARFFVGGGGGGELNLQQHWASHHALVPTPIICAPPPALCCMPKPFCPHLGEALRGNYGGN